MSIGAPLRERLLDSMKELRAHLRAEIELSETVYHVFGFNLRSFQDSPPAAGDPHRAYLAAILRDPDAVIRAVRAA